MGDVLISCKNWKLNLQLTGYWTRGCYSHLRPIFISCSNFDYWYKVSPQKKKRKKKKKRERERERVMPQFDWLYDVCECVMSPASGIYWVELGLINNCKEPQLWLVLLRYSVDVASVFPWVVTYGIRASPVIPCGFRDTTLQSGP